VASLISQDADVVFCEILGIRKLRWSDVGRILSRLWTLRSDVVSGATLPSGLKVIRPFLLPATNRLFNGINAWLLRRWLLHQVNWPAGVELIWNYSASRSARWLMDHVPHQKLVYDCTDDWLAVRGIPRFLPDDELALLKRADLTLVPSRVLEERKGEVARRIVRVPHGALVERFFLSQKSPARDGIVTLLYYGHLHRQHLDFNAIEILATSRPLWTVILVGPVKTSHAFPSNVRIVGQQPHSGLRELIREADVLILPYALNSYTEAVLPAKIYECLATGRPIVASPLPELEADFSRYIEFARSPQEWVGAIEKTLESESHDRSAFRVEFAKRNTWDIRYLQIKELIGSV
jgi:glycosyltransferase involved in cell wall biosynthesis